MDGMDRKIERKGGLSRKSLWYIFSAALFLAVLGVIIFGDKSSKYNLDASRITIETVKKDVFQDYIGVTPSYYRTYAMVNGGSRNYYIRKPDTK